MDLVLSDLKNWTADQFARITKKLNELNCILLISCACHSMNPIFGWSIVGDSRPCNLDDKRVGDRPIHALMS